MRVLIKRTIVDKIAERLDAVYAQGRKPDCVLVTPGEFHELVRDDGFMRFIPSFLQVQLDKADAEVIRSRVFQLSPQCKSPRCGTFASIERGVFQGLPLYVIPDSIINYVEQE